VLVCLSVLYCTVLYCTSTVAADGIGCTNLGERVGWLLEGEMIRERATRDGWGWAAFIMQQDNAMQCKGKGRKRRGEETRGGEGMQYEVRRGERATASCVGESIVRGWSSGGRRA
jgi:hypothetical protein